jgi:hypothetical protein
MVARVQITMDLDMLRRAQRKATELGISLAGYVRRLIAEDLEERTSKADISLAFDLVDRGPQTDIARHKDKMIAAAVWKNYRRKVRRSQGRTTRARKSDG